ncbi:MAG: tetratricopeptide repeat protein [Chitinophagaceae bacterium]
MERITESIFLRLSLGRLYDEENKTDEALNACNTILEQQPDQVNTLMLKAELLQKKNDSAGSLAALEKAYQLAPGNLEVSYKLAYQYAENKNAKVIPLADSLIAKDSLKLHGEPYYIKGLYFSNIDDKTKALQLLNETTKRDYNYLNAYIEKSKILIGQKKINEALKTLQLANTISPAFPDAYYWIGKCQEELGQKEDAKLSYEKAYGLDKTFIEAKEAADNIK